MSNTEQKLKEQIIAALNLEDITPDDIDSNAPLFGEGLGLDSIDALEITLILEKEYGIRFSNPAEAKPVFHSIATLAEYVEKNKKSE
ncbi:MAG: phosphopantetheine-binding protein [Bacteroidales bacterium]|jgi:acyl carrier protein|nr:phosphopantetheine-binding protein [Bacteroidales bacterium]